MTPSQSSSISLQSSPTSGLIAASESSQSLLLGAHPVGLGGRQEGIPGSDSSPNSSPSSSSLHRASGFRSGMKSSQSPPPRR